MQGTTDWEIISDQDLDGDARESGGYLRVKCHLHGGDHQRSLSINQETGFGSCFNCKARVLVREMNPKAVLNILSKEGREARGEAPLIPSPQTLVKRAQEQQARQQRVQARVPGWQQREITLLRSLSDSMESRLSDDRARTYLSERGISLDAALTFGVGYIPDKQFTGKYAPLAPWADRIVFPVSHPADEEPHFVGRSLKFWETGMDEETHKTLLEDKGIKRYIKTHRGGWFAPAHLSPELAIFVEGAFDALALLDAGIPASAIIGTSLTLEWVPTSLTRITLAFDGDTSGREKAQKTADELNLHGFDAVICCPPDDGMGKDWSERYRLHGYDGLAPLLNPASSTAPEDELGSGPVRLTVEEVKPDDNRETVSPSICQPATTSDLVTVETVQRILAERLPGWKVEQCPNDYTLAQRVEDLRTDAKDLERARWQIVRAKLARPKSEQWTRDQVRSKHPGEWSEEETEIEPGPDALPGDAEMLTALEHKWHSDEVEMPFWRAICGYRSGTITRKECLRRLQEALVSPDPTYQREARQDLYSRLRVIVTGLRHQLYRVA